MPPLWVPMSVGQSILSCPISGLIDVLARSTSLKIWNSNFLDGQETPRSFRVEVESIRLRMLIPILEVRFPAFQLARPHLRHRGMIFLHWT